jgi:hypothetical protein
VRGEARDEPAILSDGGVIRPLPRLPIVSRTNLPLDYALSHFWLTFCRMSWSSQTLRGGGNLQPEFTFISHLHL